jgi:hypothetical protein
MPKVVDPFEDFGKHLVSFPDATLRDLARNDAAPHNYRKQAVEVLYGRKSPYLKHQDLQPFVHELEIELDGIQFDHPAPSEPMRASVTTQSLYGQEVVGFTGFDNVQLRNKPDPLVSEANVRLINSMLEPVDESKFERDTEEPDAAK